MRGLDVRKIEYGMIADNREPFWFLSMPINIVIFLLVVLRAD